MKIKQIHLKDFKRFKDLTIDLGNLPKRLVALVGPNGCGKSSVFDAMTYTNKYWFGQLGQSGSKDYHYYSLTNEPQFGVNNINIEFDKGKFDGVANEFSNVGKENTLISFRSPYRYSGNLKVKESKAVEDITHNRLGATTSSDVDQRIEEGYRRLTAKYNKYRDDNDIKPSEAKKHIIGELNSALVNCLDLEIVNLGNIDGDNGTLFFKKTDSDIEFEYNVLSSGEKEVVDILLDLYLRKDKYNDTIYIIDEPELHINTSIQRQLLIEINKMIPDNCQIWIATHSIGFMRALQVDFPNDSQIIKFDAHNKWASEKYILKPIIPSRREWLNIFATAIDDLAELISPNRIVYCEGKIKTNKNNDEQGLDARVYNKIFYEEYPDTVFVSSGGNTLLESNSKVAINILSKVYKEIEIFTLKDLDSNSGKAVDDNFRTEYLRTHNKNHRMLKRFEIENYLYDKEVLSAYCKDRQLVFDENKYNGIVKDIVLEDIKSKTNEIKICCGVDINKSNDSFKMELAETIKKGSKVYNELKDVIFNE